MFDDDEREAAPPTNRFAVSKRSVSEVVIYYLSALADGDILQGGHRAIAEAHFYLGEFQGIYDWLAVADCRRRHLDYFLDLHPEWDEKRRCRAVVLILRCLRWAAKEGLILGHRIRKGAKP